MSAFNNVPTLLQSCLNYYLDHLDILLSDRVMCQDFSSSNVDYVFDQIIQTQTHNLEDVDQIIRFISLFGFKITKVQLSLRIRRFEESAVRVSAKSKDLLSLMGERLNGNMLRHLNIYDHPLQFDMNQLCSIVQNWHQLTFIRLIMANLDDRIIEVVARSCPDLRELYLFGMNYSDSVLRLLAGNSDKCESNCPSENEQIATNYQIYVGCKKLKRLIFLPNNFNLPKFSSSCLANLLLQLRELIQLKIPHNVIDESLIALMASNRNTRLNLTDIDVNFASIHLHQSLAQNAAAIKRFSQGDIFCHDNNLSIGDDDIKVTYLCALACLIPNLQKIHITLQKENEIRNLNILARFCKINALSLTIDISHDHIASEVGFEVVALNQSERSLNRLLSDVHTLTDLDLQNISSVDIYALGRMCPNLKRLQISNVKRLRYVSESILPAQFSQLKQLILCGHSDSIIDELCLQELLASCVQVQLLTLGWCTELSDDLMQTVLQRNQMHCIERLEFHELSEKLTIALVRQFVFTRMQPLMMNIFACNGIEQTDINRLAEEIKARNRNVIIKYYNL